MRKNTKTRFLWLILGLLVGALVILAIRFFTYKPERVHYHANFAVYINGQREQFQGPRYYEETEETMCASNNAHSENPSSRAHLHDNVNDVVHIEDHLVTWGNFFENLGWVVSPQVIASLSQVMPADSDHKISFILNGKPVKDITSRVIQDQDRLLVDYGNTASQDLQKEFSTVATTAHHYDVTPDPTGCAGAAPTTFHDRLTHLF